MSAALSVRLLHCYSKPGTDLGVITWVIFYKNQDYYYYFLSLVYVLKNVVYLQAYFWVDMEPCAQSVSVRRGKAIVSSDKEQCHRGCRDLKFKIPFQLPLVSFQSMWMLRSCRQTLGPSLTGLRPLSFGQSSFEVYHGVIFSQSANMHMVNDVATFFIYMDTTEAPKRKFKIWKRFKFSDWSSKKNEASHTF